MRHLILAFALVLGILTALTAPADASCRYSDGTYRPCPTIGR